MRDEWVRIDGEVYRDRFLYSSGHDALVPWYFEVRGVKGTWVVLASVRYAIELNGRCLRFGSSYHSLDNSDEAFDTKDEAIEFAELMIDAIKDGKHIE